MTKKQIDKIKAIAYAIIGLGILLFPGFSQEDGDGAKAIIDSIGEWVFSGYFVIKGAVEFYKTQVAD